MRRRFALVWWILSGLHALAAQAQVPVQTGEHPGFTRIAIAYPAAPGWTVLPVAGGWEFRTAGESPGFDLSRAFDLAGRSRMQSLAATHDVLAIVSDCDCHLEAWTFRGSIPIIDIHDGPARPGTGDIGRYEQPAPSPPEAVPEAEIAEAATRAASPPPTVPQLPLDGAAQRRARDLEARLGEALGQAGAQGMLEPSGGSPVGDLSSLAGAVAQGAPPDSHVLIETAVDRASGSRAEPAAPLTPDGIACPDPDLFELAAWGALTDGRPDFPGWTTGLIDELGALDLRAVERAARFQLYLGFGAEAAQLLELLPETPDRTLLGSLAGVLDNTRPSRDVNGLAAWKACASPAALWGVLAAGEITRGETVDTGALISAVRALPPHLRQVLAPRVIAILTAAGDTETALRLRNLETDPPGGPSAPAALASAGLEEQLRNPAGAERILTEALKGPAADSAEVLLALARQRLARGARLTPEEFGALEAHAYQHRADPLASALQQVLASAEIGAGAFSAAGTRISGMVDDGTAAELWRQLFVAVADQAQPAELLRLTLAHAFRLAHDGQDLAARARVASRLLEAGFAPDALALLEASPEFRSEAGSDAATEAEVQLLAARADLAMGRAAAVLARLADRNDPESLALLANAQEKLGNLDSARRLYESSGRMDELRRLDDRAGFWPGGNAAGATGEPGEPEAEGRMAQAVSASQDSGEGMRLRSGGSMSDAEPAADGEPDENPDLQASARRLIQRSAEDRAQIAGLLAER